MIGEFDLFGVFIPAVLACGVAALLISIPLRRLLSVIGFYRLVWHRGLFDLCLLVILWGAVSAATAALLHPAYPTR